MTWFLSKDIHAFLDAAGDFLRSQPVENTVLLTEAAYLQAQPSSAADQLYGWWQNAHSHVAGAFLQAPRHPPVLSPMSGQAIEALADMLGSAPAVGVPGALTDSVRQAWKHTTGVELIERSRITLYRLEKRDLTAHQPAGTARVARPDDRELLLEWYHQMMAAYPDDPSEAAYVVDDPISFGGITLWEVDGRPMAMAGRSRLIAGMVRLSAVYAPDGDDIYTDAAFTAASHAARQIADHVLVFAPAGDNTTSRKYRQLGFQPTLDRVMLHR